MTRPPGVGIIGLGFMGRTHLKAYRRAAAAGFANRLVAVADADAERRQGRSAGPGNLEREACDERLFAPEEVRGHADPAELLADPEVDVVSICTPTASHVPLAMAALAAGKHVLVEKPLALTAAAARPLLAAVERADAVCMPAMCMRFWPAWAWLKERVDDGSFGAVRSAAFRRLGSRPTWAGFYADPAQSGGALLDLHIHDADFVQHLFGAPQRVEAAGSLDHVTCLYRYQAGPAHVVAEGGWDHADGFPFRMRYTVVFDRATADFDLGRAPELLLFRGGRGEQVQLPANHDGTPLDGYDLEIRHFLAAVSDRRTPLAATIPQAVELLEMLDGVRARVIP